MTRITMLALAALSLLMLVAAACSVVHVEDFDLGRYYNSHFESNTSGPRAVEPPGPYVRIVYLTLPSGDRILLYRGPFDNSYEASGRSPACFFP